MVDYIIKFVSVKMCRLFKTEQNDDSQDDEGLEDIDSNNTENDNIDGE